MPTEHLGGSTYGSTGDSHDQLPRNPIDDILSESSLASQAKNCRVNLWDIVEFQNANAVVGTHAFTHVQLGGGDSIYRTNGEIVQKMAEAIDDRQDHSCVYELEGGLTSTLNEAMVGLQQITNHCINPKVEPLLDWAIAMIQIQQACCNLDEIGKYWAEYNKNDSMWHVALKSLMGYQTQVDVEGYSLAQLIELMYTQDNVLALWMKSHGNARFNDLAAGFRAMFMMVNSSFNKMMTDCFTLLIQEHNEISPFIKLNDGYRSQFFSDRTKDPPHWLLFSIEPEGEIQPTFDASDIIQTTAWSNLAQLLPGRYGEPHLVKFCLVNGIFDAQTTLDTLLHMINLIDESRRIDKIFRSATLMQKAAEYMRTVQQAKSDMKMTEYEAYFWYNYLGGVTQDPSLLSGSKEVEESQTQLTGQIPRSPRKAKVAVKAAEGETGGGSGTWLLLGALAAAVYLYK